MFLLLCIAHACTALLTRWSDITAHSLDECWAAAAAALLSALTKRWQTLLCCVGCVVDIGSVSGCAVQQGLLGLQLVCSGIAPLGAGACTALVNGAFECAVAKSWHSCVTSREECVCCD
jgi:hypothetical protein